MKNAPSIKRKKSARAPSTNARVERPARTRRNTFESYQQSKQADRLAIIEPYLKELAQSRVRFEHVTALAEMVAQHLALKQSKPCRASTLLRNRRYKVPLLAFMTDRVAFKSGGKSSPDGGPDVAAFQLKLEAGNLRREVERLKHHIAHLEAQPIHIGADSDVPSANSEGKKSTTDQQVHFAQTCQALQLVLQHMNQSVELDAKNMRIVDKSKLRNNVIVDSSLGRPFFEWLNSNQSNTLIRQLRDGRETPAG